ncbi:similar to tyrosine kinase Fps/Fes (predicted), isoform CRA_g [Rattus norvegicus]|uniref:Similar to tyrosine kinase Fps/Fes (Predicted), isoform CRA_g n=1 Tax=Rattus norvegicus TaxID=10116 RepID=A6JCB6_RAT|nr:similar to tyrosine kinase Fps/Fes (predicted), isoform CRA_g [Rattus norvegicus]
MRIWCWESRSEGGTSERCLVDVFVQTTPRWL